MNITNIVERLSDTRPEITDRLRILSELFPNGILAGGAVRDTLLGIEPNDWDIFYSLDKDMFLRRDSLDITQRARDINVDIRVISRNGSGPPDTARTLTEYERWRNRASQGRHGWRPPMNLKLSIAGGRAIKVQLIQSATRFVTPEDLLKVFDFTINMFVLVKDLKSEYRIKGLITHQGSSTTYDARNWIKNFPKGYKEVRRPCHSAVDALMTRIVCMGCGGDDNPHVIGKRYLNNDRMGITKMSFDSVSSLMDRAYKLARHVDGTVENETLVTLGKALVVSSPYNYDQVGDIAGGRTQSTSLADETSKSRGRTDSTSDVWADYRTTDPGTRTTRHHGVNSWNVARRPSDRSRF